MLKTLNKLFTEQPVFSVCSELDGRQETASPQFFKDVNRMRKRLASEPFKRWLLVYEQPYLFSVSLFALMSLNKTIVLSANKKPRWLEEINHAFDVILGDDCRDLETQKSKLAINQQQLAAIEIAENNPIQFSGKELVIFYTSGSTGQPKAISKQLVYLSNEVATLESTFGQSVSNTRFVSSVSQFHIYGLLFNIFWPLITQRLWLNDILEFQEQLIEMSHSKQLLALISSPAWLTRLELITKIDNVATIFSSGGPLSSQSANKAQTVFGSLPFEVYGSTETGGIGYRQQSKKDCAWRLFAKVRLSQNNQVTRLDSPHIDLCKPMELDDKLILLDEHSFILVGRSDRVVKIEEKRVSLTEIESFLISQEFIEKCVCVVIEGRRTLLGVVLVLSEQGIRRLAADGRRRFIESFKSSMRLRFENVTIPRKWRIVEAIPVNQQSKIEYSELVCLFE